jgi:hypothetical protein
MKPVLCALAMAAAFAPFARAELPPHVYEAERRAASDVLVLSDLTMTPFEGEADRGACTLSGRIEAVERGAGYQTGGVVSVKIACITKAWRPIPGPFPGYTQEFLTRLERVRVFVNGGRVVPRGLDTLEKGQT